MGHLARFCVLKPRVNDLVVLLSQKPWNALYSASEPKERVYGELLLTWGLALGLFNG